MPADMLKLSDSTLLSISMVTLSVEKVINSWLSPSDSAPNITRVFS